MSSPTPLEARLIDLEIRIAHQDKALAVLDEVVREFALRVQRLERQVGELRRAADPDLGPADDKPPHY